MRARLRRPSLLAKFSVLSLLVIVALGAGIGSVLQERIERRALAEATRLAETVTAVGLEPALLLGDLEPYPTLSRLDALDEELGRRAFDELEIKRMKLFNAEVTIVYSDERSIVGETHPGSPGVQAALRGQVGG